MEGRVALRGGLLLGVGLVALALSGCTALETVRVDRIDYATQYTQNGPAGPSRIYWSGGPAFPVRAHMEPAPGCNSGNSSCGPLDVTFSAPAEPLILPTAGNCTGNTPSTVPPWHVEYYYQLIDAHGQRSAAVPIRSTCYFTSVPLLYTATVLHTEPWLTQVLRPVTDVSWKALDVSKSLVLSLGLIFLIAFPSQLFNSTMQSHYDEVMGWFTWAQPLRRLATWLMERTQGTGERPPRWVLGGAFLLGGLLGSLLDPGWGFDLTTLEEFLGILLATAFTTAVYTTLHHQYLRRALHLSGHLRVYGGGILVALACLLVSRLTSAEPGYLYGVLLGYTLGAAAPQLPRHHEGRNIALGATAMLAVSVTVWLLWTPVKAAADATSAFPLVVLSTAMAGVFAGGMTTLLFGLLPLRWLDGEKLLAWQRFVWLALVLAGMFLFVHVVMNNAASAPHPGRNLAVSVALFIAFGLLSTGCWAYFRFRPEPLAVGGMSPAP